MSQVDTKIKISYNSSMNLEIAVDIILNFSEANQVDPLKGIELMVEHFRQLSPTELRAIRVFMEESDKVDNKIT
jgi:hypothetical protein